MNRRFALAACAASLLGATSAFAGSAPGTVHVFKSPTCGCCEAWVDHFRAAGFQVKVTAVKDTTEARKRFGMPDTYGSCHTALVDDYVVEGHVPAAEVKRLLSSRPAAIGLAVPGMPPSSPGMDVPGRKDAYEVLLVDRQGKSTVFASYPRS